MRRSIIVIVVVGLFLISFLSLAPSPTSLAQRDTPTPTGGRETPTPTPTTGGGTPTPTSDGGGGKQDEEGTPAPTPLTGVVRGMVYNYSNAAPEAGVTVVLDGGGWKAETVTTSEGDYIFAGLGSSSAKLSLRLPADAHSVMPDYPVHTGSSDPAGVNIGFYWGENPPIPVILSVEEESIAASPEQPFNLTVLVKNQSGGEATGGEIDVQLPGGLIALQAKADHGQVDFTDHRVWGRLDTLPDGQRAALSVQIQFEAGATPREKTAQITFTYNEQITPQLIRVNVLPLDGDAGSGAAAMSAAPTAEMAGSTSDTAPAESTAAPIAGNDTTTTEAAPEQSASGAAATEPTAAPAAGNAVSAEATPKPAANDAASGETQAESENLIPTTGNQTTPSSATWISLILSVIFIVGLSVAGLRAFARRGSL